MQPATAMATLSTTFTNQDTKHRKETLRKRPPQNQGQKIADSRKGEINACGRASETSATVIFVTLACRHYTRLKKVLTGARPEKAKKKGKRARHWTATSDKRKNQVRAVVITVHIFQISKKWKEALPPNKKLGS